MPPKIPRPAHSWESEAHAWEPGGPAEHECDGWPSGDDTDFEEEKIIDSEQRFVEHMLAMYNCRKLSAKDFCIAMYFAGLSGVTAAARFGYRPDASSGHYQRHLDPILGYKAYNSDFYMVDLPSYNRSDASRCVRPTPIFLPHEMLASEMDSDPSLGLRLDEMKSDLPSCYWDHPIVKSSVGRPVLPCAIYLDAVPYSHTDSVIGFWIENLVSSRRHLFCTLRKKCACVCGCHGWCTLNIIFNVLNWSLECLAKGLFPSNTHLGVPWGEGQDHRTTIANTEMSFCAAVLFVKGDWSEFVTSLGFPAWTDGLRPCFCCNGFDDIYESSGCNPIELRWRGNGEAEYFQDCASCEVIVVLTRAQHTVISKQLRWDKRKTGARGRALTVDFPAAGLLVGDRLECGADVVDIGDFENIDLFPCRCIFWRRANETATRHRNSLFNLKLGITPVGSLALDTLHVVYLGIMTVYCRVAVWYLLCSRVFAGPGASEEGLQVAVMAFTFQLQEFYKSWDKAHPSELLTRVSEFTLKMLGTKDAPKLKLKGAETYGMLHFVLHVFQTHSARFDAHGRRLQRAGEALRSIIRVWKSANRVLKPAEIQDLRCKNMRSQQQNHTHTNMEHWTIWCHSSCL